MANEIKELEQVNDLSVLDMERIKQFEQFIHAEIDSKEDWMLFIRSTWDYLYKEKEIISTPLFQSPVVETVLLKIFSSLIKLRRLQERKRQQNPKGKRQMLHRGDNILLSGVKGVGKSCLMRGMFALIKALVGDKIKCVFIDYEQQKGTFPSKELGYPQDVPFVDYDINQWCNTTPTGVICFGDEIPVLYENESPEEVERSQRIIGEWVAIGKSNYALGIISGSTSSIKSLAHKVDPNDKRHLGFPNLNFTVYKNFSLLPVRSRSELKKWLSQLGKDTTEIDLNNIFMRSGGVGGLIQDVIRGNSFDDSVKAFNVQLEQSPSFRSLMGKFYLLNKDSFDCWNQKSLSFAQCQEVVSSIQLEDLRDSGFLYLKEEEHFTRYELLIPHYFSLLQTFFKLPDRHQMLALEVLLRGWQNGGSTGVSLEPLVCGKIIAAKLDPFVGASYHHGTFTFAMSNKTDIPHLNQSNLDEYLDEIMYAKGDNGGDGFRFTKDNGLYSVDLLQIKLGVRDKEIRMGSSLTGDASVYFSVIKANAERAWDTLIQQLPQVQFSLKSFTLFTNKLVVPEVAGQQTLTFGEMKVPFFCYDREMFDTLFSEELKQLGMS